MNTTMRILVREGDDGFVRALVPMRDGELSACLLEVPASIFNASEQVRTAFNELVKAMFAQIVHEADPAVSVESFHVTAPGGAATH